MSSVEAENHTSEFESPPSRGLTRWDIWAGLLPLLAISPMLFFQMQSLWSRTHMQFFPLAIAAVAFLTYGGLRGGESTHPVRRWTALAILALATILYVFGVWEFSPWLGQLSAILVFFAWALGRCGNTRWTSIAAWTALLLTTLPLPLNKDTQLIQWLQKTSSWACGKACDALAIPNLRLANVVQIRGQELFVEEACSGIGSLYALLAVAMLLLILNQRSFLVSLFALLSVLVWASVGNFIRLMAIVVAQEYYQHDLSHGTDHDILGLLTFLIAAGCFWLTEGFLAKMLQPVPIADADFGAVFSWFNTALSWPARDPSLDIVPEDEDDRREFLRMRAEYEARKKKYQPMVWTDKRWVYRSVLAFAAIMLMVGLAPAMVVARGGVAAISFGLPTIRGEKLEAFPDEEALPPEVGEFRRVGYHREARSAASNFGENSLIWHYAWQNQLVAVSLDFPFDSWHPLSVCYRNAGWNIQGQEVFDGDAGDEVWPWEEIEMSNPLGGRGYVYFCAFTEDMAPFTDVPGAGVSDRLAAGAGIVGALTGAPKQAVKATYQIQMYFEAGGELPRAERRQLRERFLELREILKSAAEPAIRQVAEE